MEYLTLIFFGGLIGMQHALEADHLAAVAALSRENSTRRNIVLRGSAWGLGHTVTLLTICSALWFFGQVIPESTEALLEFVVGAMIVLLGINVIVTMRRRRMHVHVHDHGDGEKHLHVHAHADDEVPHEQSAHRHEHAARGTGRALVVGMVHGVAGSAGLMVLAAAAQSVTQALGYVIAFGVGSIVGMAALSFVASYPLRWVEKGARWVSTAAYASIAGFAIFVGVNLMSHSWAAL
jgi:ABC-type nickel/cobalt efflux system permease component RcnA